MQAPTGSDGGLDAAITALAGIGASTASPTVAGSASVSASVMRSAKEGWGATVASCIGASWKKRDLGACQGPVTVLAPGSGSDSGVFAGDQGLPGDESHICRKVHQ